MNKQNQKNKLDEYYKSLLGERIYVLGEGNIASPIVFIGEAPGGDEEASGRPFVGKAGKNLNSFLEAIGFERSSIYITNAVKFRPVNVNEKTGRRSNRTPKATEIAEYREWLLKELALIQPKLVVTLGNTPLFALTSSKAPTISEIHGTVTDFKNDEFGLEFKLMPFYHPAAVIYRRELVKEYEQDILKFSMYVKDNIK